MRRVDGEIHDQYPAEASGLKEWYRATTDHRRRSLALPYGLGPEATWDQIYKEWKAEYGHLAMAMKVVIYAGIPFALILLISVHWIAVAIAVLVFLAISLLVVLVHGFTVEHEYYEVGLNNPELKELAEQGRIWTR